MQGLMKTLDTTPLCLKRPSLYCLIHFYKRCVSALALIGRSPWVRSGWVSVLVSHKHLYSGLKRAHLKSDSNEISRYYFNLGSQSLFFCTFSFSSFCLSISSLYLSLLSIYPSVSLSLSIYLSISLFVSLSFYVSLSLSLSLSLSVSLSLSFSLLFSLFKDN